MSRRPLRRANRDLLRAIETPPDSGVEDRLDDLAARLWYLAEEQPSDPDPAQIARLRYLLRELAVREPRAAQINAA
jgi:hypothetical protein